jgi:VIT1/CCC1 family predicted Fe2+/Mn2+ transporter
MANRDRAELGQLKKEHTPAAVKSRLKSAARHSYLHDFVYGGIDGAVTTFAIVSGVVGADLPPGVIIILGLANLIGDGFSMAAGNFLATRAEEQVRESTRREEEHHVDTYPEGEVEEVRQLVRRKGFEGDDLERAVEIITSDRRQWIEMMLAEEHGMPPTSASPWRAAAATFAAFVTVGLLPLVAYLAAFLWPEAVPQPFAWSIAATSLAFFAVGAIKSTFVDQHWVWSALETLGVGGAAAGLAYLVGWSLRGIAP